MAPTYEYIISLRDKASQTMRTITGCSAETVTKLTALSVSAGALQRSGNDLGGCLFNLREKMSLLQREKELINPSNITTIRQYNREINELQTEIDELDNAGASNKLGGYFNTLKEQAKAFINPLTVGIAAVGFATKSALEIDEGMAKINITAQLDQMGLSDLKGKLKKMAKENKVDFAVVPSGFEKIISQTGDVKLSLGVMDAALKGSKAGFVDLDTVTGALAQTLSIVGAENANAKEVLDTFFAAKRVGAGEFKDFAAYMPGLIAGADSLGVNYKSVAGMFAYMTGKGQDAARSSTLMANMFSALGKTDITKNLDKAGVKIFDAQGKMRSVVDVFTDLKGVIGTMSDQQKSGFLEKIGIVDKEAKSAFSIMTADIEKLKSAMYDTSNSSGETAKALEFSKNEARRATEVWNNFKNIGAEFGELILPVISVGLDLLQGVLNVVSPLVGGITTLFKNWSVAIRDGNPFIIALTVLIGGLVVALAAREVIEGKLFIATRARAFWDGVLAAKTATVAAAQWMLNTALYGCPVVWIIAAIAAIVGVVILCWNKFEGFRKIVLGVWEVLKSFGKMIWDSIVTSIRGMIDGFGTLGGALSKFLTGDFQGAAADAKEGVEKLWEASPIVATVKTAVKTDYSGAWDKGVQKGADSWVASNAVDAKVMPTVGDVKTQAISPAGRIEGYDEIMEKLDKSKKDGTTKKGDVIDLNKETVDYRGTAAYSSIVSRLSPIKLPSLGAAAASLAMPLAMSTPAKLPATPSMQPPVIESTIGINQDENNMTGGSTGRGKTITMDRFCEKIEIHVQNAGDMGGGAIGDAIIAEITKSIDNYEA